jgi:hypothetical protein
MRRQAGLVCPALLLETWFSSLTPKNLPRWLTIFLIDLTLVKVKIFPEFKRNDEELS